VEIAHVRELLAGSPREPAGDQQHERGAGGRYRPDIRSASITRNTEWHRTPDHLSTGGRSTAVR
jgi:hypothetical protein